MNLNMQQNNCAISFEEFKLIVKWYEYSYNLRKKIMSPIINSFFQEYYFIDSTWIKNFENVFQYNKYLKLISQIKNGNETPLQDIQISKIYSNYKQFFSNSQINKNGISRNSSKNKIIRQIPNYQINYYYENFFLLDKGIFDLFNNYFTLIDSPKAEVLLGNGIFILNHVKNSIEVGYFEDKYPKDILLFIYEDQKERKEEIEKIKKMQLDQYLKSYQIKKEKIKGEKILKPNGKKFIVIKISDINDIFYEINDNINKETQNKITEYIGLENSDHKSSLMNSLIQLLTSIKKLRVELKEKKDEIESFNNIYILSSFFIKFINKIYSENRKKNNDPDLEKKMKIIINFINPNLNNNSVTNYLLFFLNTLHDELNTSPKKSIENPILLESFPSPLSDANQSLNIFENYYKEYYISKISELFNWISRKKKNMH